MFYLVWTSGHVPPRTMYYTETDSGWCAGDDANDAKRFRSAALALARWRMLIYADDYYESCISSGCVRAEAVDQLSLCL